MTPSQDQKPPVMNIGVAGCAGRMGRAVLQCLAQTPGAALAGGIEAAAGQDLGALAGGGATGVLAGADAGALFARADAVIDFSTAAAAAHHAELAASCACVHVIGVTGQTAEQKTQVRAASRRAVIISSGNMSLGVTLLAALVRSAARALGPDWDIEIAEIHHRHKADAPSGTALLLGAAAAAGRKTALEVAQQERAAQRSPAAQGPRAPGSIGFAALRGGTVVGEHRILFAGPQEQVVLKHVAEDRAIFARGALAAALWGRGRKPGLYGMDDVLGLRP